MKSQFQQTPEQRIANVALGLLAGIVLLAITETILFGVIYELIAAGGSNEAAPIVAFGFCCIAAPALMIGAWAVGQSVYSRIGRHYNVRPTWIFGLSPEHMQHESQTEPKPNDPRCQTESRSSE
jgi:hypothetical protein